MGLVTGCRAFARLFRWRSHRVFRERIAALCAFVEAETLRTGFLSRIHQKNSSPSIFSGWNRLAHRTVDGILLCRQDVQNWTQGLDAAASRVTCLDYSKVNHTRQPPMRKRRGEVASFTCLAARPQGVTIQKYRGCQHGELSVRRDHNALLHQARVDPFAQSRQSLAAIHLRNREAGIVPSSSVAFSPSPPPNDPDGARYPHSCCTTSPAN